MQEETVILTDDEIGMNNQETQRYICDLLADGVIETASMVIEWRGIEINITFEENIN